MECPGKPALNLELSILEQENDHPERRSSSPQHTIHPPLSSCHLSAGASHNPWVRQPPEKAPTYPQNSHPVATHRARDTSTNSVAHVQTAILGTFESQIGKAWCKRGDANNGRTWLQILGPLVVGIQEWAEREDNTLSDSGSQPS